MSPRMWPVGYILESPYSPLQLEHKFPQNNWRDAFEDLILLESGGQMISPDSRKKEADVAAILRSEEAHRHVSGLNQMLQFNEKNLKLYQRLHKQANLEKDERTIKVIDTEVIPTLKQGSEQAVTAGQEVIERLKTSKGLPASRCKPRGKWIASLVSSGALPGWYSSLYFCADGSQVGILKPAGSSDEPNMFDGQLFTELELEQRVEKGKPFDLGDPQWSTSTGQIPGISRQQNFDDLSENGGSWQDVVPRPFIAAQHTRAERTTHPNGTMSTKVVLENVFSDGKREEKIVVQDTGKVLEEVMNAQVSMEDQVNDVNTMLQEADHEALKKIVEQSGA